jgi:hypothetical protein
MKIVLDTARCSELFVIHSAKVGEDEMGFKMLARQVR